MVFVDVAELVTRLAFFGDSSCSPFLPHLVATHFQRSAVSNSHSFAYSSTHTRTHPKKKEQMKVGMTKGVGKTSPEGEGFTCVQSQERGEERGKHANIHKCIHHTKHECTSNDQKQERERHLHAW
mmetsp:Transcript_35359/g.91963  ORF Transcript_35359/g.91963 Transcript_35359/m.91963 type:complete len:125 (+) Transcript_35359:626-1000(+)